MNFPHRRNLAQGDATAPRRPLPGRSTPVDILFQRAQRADNGRARNTKTPDAICCGASQNPRPFFITEMGTKPCKSAAGMKSAFCHFRYGLGEQSPARPTLFNASLVFNILKFPAHSAAKQADLYGYTSLARLRERSKIVSQASPWPSPPCQRKNPRTDLYMHARMRLKTRPGHGRSAKSPHPASGHACAKNARPPRPRKARPEEAFHWDFGVNPTNFLRPYAHNPAEEAASAAGDAKRRPGKVA